MANTENLKILRLTNGEEVMAEVTSDGDKFMTVKNAVRVEIGRAHV